MSTQRVKDPICGMMVDPARSIEVVLDGETYYLCSERCADRLKETKAGRVKQ